MTSRLLDEADFLSSISPDGTAFPAVGAAIVCRMSSTRFPGKSLARVCGKPLIQYIVESLRAVLPGLRTAVVTSTDRSDDAIAAFAEECGLHLVRGQLDDVAGRLALAIRRLGLEHVFRVNGDSPLAPVALFPLAMRALGEGDWDLVTNVFPRTFPPGMSLELIRGSSFLRAYPDCFEPEDREHVTRLFYRNPDRFRILNLTMPVDLSTVSLAIDTPADLAVFERMVRTMKKPHWAYSVPELLALRQRAIDGC